jgi:hypothetical protein
MNVCRGWIAALALAASVAACGAGQAAEPEAFFPLMAWDHVPNDPAVIAEMKACGLTIAGFAAPAALDNCHAAGLKAIVSDARTSGYDWTAVDAKAAREKVREVVGEVRNHPAVYGYYLRDEPTAGFFAGLAAVSDAVKEFHPGAWPYINLFPNYADAGQLGAASYDAYLEQFVATCKPPILSYDHYALLEDGGLRPNYFDNLEAVRRAGLKHGLPTWNIVLASSHFNYREVSAADLRWQVNTSLAYGYRGIGYFTYFSPKHGNFRMGPIDQFGHKTTTWDALRQINLQVHQLAPTLLKLKSDRVYHFGEVPQGCTGPDDASLVTAAGGPLLVGDFTHEDGTRYVMAVNKDFKSSTYCSLQYRKAPTAIEQVSPYTGGLTPFVGEYGWLAPGQAALLKLTY